MNCERCKEYVEVNPESIIIGDVYCLECAKEIEKECYFRDLVNGNVELDNG